MKNNIVLILFITIIIQPYISVTVFNNALIEKNSYTLTKVVDFDELRHNIKARYRPELHTFIDKVISIEYMFDNKLRQSVTGDVEFIIISLSEFNMVLRDGTILIFTRSGIIWRLTDIRHH